MDRLRADHGIDAQHYILRQPPNCLSIYTVANRRHAMEKLRMVKGVVLFTQKRAKQIDGHVCVFP
jgi:hypothetical protein